MQVDPDTPTDAVRAEFRRANHRVVRGLNDVVAGVLDMIDIEEKSGMLVGNQPDYQEIKRLALLAIEHLDAMDALDRSEDMDWAAMRRALAPPEYFADKEPGGDST